MNWIEIEKGLPKENHVVLVQYRSGALEYKPYTGPEDWWKRNVMRWLNEQDEYVIDNNVSDITEIMREADKAFEKVGGSTRHYIRDVFIPMLNERGYHFTKKQSL